MDALDELFVPVLFRFVERAADREDVDFCPLPLQLRHFAVAKGLAERREPLEQVSHLAHRRRLDAGRSGCNCLWSRRAVPAALSRRAGRTDRAGRLQAARLLLLEVACSTGISLPIARASSSWS